MISEISLSLRRISSGPRPRMSSISDSMSRSRSGRVIVIPEVRMYSSESSTIFSLTNSRSVTSILFAYCSRSLAWTAVLAAAKAGVTGTAAVPARSASPPPDGGGGCAGVGGGAAAGATAPAATGCGIGAGAPLLGGATTGGGATVAPAAPGTPARCWFAWLTRSRRPILQSLPCRGPRPEADPATGLARARRVGRWQGYERNREIPHRAADLGVGQDVDERLRPLDRPQHRLGVVGELGGDLGLQARLDLGQGDAERRVGAVDDHLDAVAGDSQPLEDPQRQLRLLHRREAEVDQHHDAAGPLQCLQRHLPEVRAGVDHDVVEAGLEDLQDRPGVLGGDQVGELRALGAEEDLEPARRLGHQRLDELAVDVGKGLHDLVDVPARIEAEEHPEVTELEVEVEERRSLAGVLGEARS